MRHTDQFLGLGLSCIVILAGFAIPRLSPAQAQSAGSRSRVLSSNAVTIRSDNQEANSKTGVITARGNVQVYYPSRQIQATAAQAQYFSRERRIVMTGNVYVLQAGNSLRGEMITYLMDEGRFVATPRPTRQVESVYIIQDATESPAPAPKPVVTPARLRPLALPGLAPIPADAPSGPNFANP